MRSFIGFIAGLTGLNSPRSVILKNGFIILLIILHYSSWTIDENVVPLLRAPPFYIECVKSSSLKIQLPVFINLERQYRVIQCLGTLHSVSKVSLFGLYLFQKTCYNVTIEVFLCLMRRTFTYSKLIFSSEVCLLMISGWVVSIEKS